MNKGLFAAALASVALVGGLVVFSLSGKEEALPAEPSEIAPPVLPYRPPPEPVMPPWSDEDEQGSTPEVDSSQAEKNIEEKSAPPKKKTGGLLPRPNRAPLPKVARVEVTPEEQRLIDESFVLLEPFTDLVDDGRDIEAVLEAEKWLNHPNREVRLEIAFSLDWIGLPAANQLARMVDDPDPEVREAAQSGFWDALSESEDPYLKAELLTIAAEANDVEVRENTIDELTSLPDYISFPLLARYLNDPDEFIRQDVLDNLEFISSEEITTYEQAMAWYEANKDELMELEADELLIPEELQKP